MVTWNRELLSLTQRLAVRTLGNFWEKTRPDCVGKMLAVCRDQKILFVRDDTADYFSKGENFV